MRFSTVPWNLPPYMPAEDRAVKINRKVGWLSLLLGASSGIVLGLWSFSGPVPVPEFLGAYDDVARRLARLGHIAFFGLGILNLLVARELPRLTLPAFWLRLASLSMIVGNVLMPSVLFAASACHPFKYALPVPATAVTFSLAIICYGVFTRAEERADGRR